MQGIDMPPQSPKDKQKSINTKPTWSANYNKLPEKMQRSVKFLIVRLMYTLTNNFSDEGISIY